MKQLLIIIIAAIALTSCSKSVDTPSTSSIKKSFTIGKDSTLTIEVGRYQDNILGTVNANFKLPSTYVLGAKIGDNFQNSESFLIAKSISDPYKGSFTGENYLYGYPSTITLMIEKDGTVTYLKADNPAPIMHEKR